MSSWVRQRLQLHEDRVDPEQYAMSLFYVHHDDRHYLECKRDLERRNQQA